MSTYYFLVCEDCKESCNCATTSGKYGGSPLIDAEITLYPFVVLHAHHNVKIVDESRYNDEEYIEWSEENLIKMRFETERDVDDKRVFKEVLR